MADNITTHNNTVHSSEKNPNSEVTQHKPLIRKTPSIDGRQYIQPKEQILLLKNQTLTVNNIPNHKNTVYS